MAQNPGSSPATPAIPRLRNASGNIVGLAIVRRNLSEHRLLTGQGKSKQYSPMPFRYVTFLRSINIGGRNVKMDELRRIFESAGFSQVETFIASGNVVFESVSRSIKALETKIAARLRQALGYEVATFVRSIDELATIVKHKLFAKRREYDVLYIAFLSQPPGEAARANLTSLQTRTDRFHFQGRELYWICRTRFSDSTFSGPLLEKVLGAQATVRNSNTVAKIAAKYSHRQLTSNPGRAR